MSTKTKTGHPMHNATIARTGEHRLGGHRPSFSADDDDRGRVPALQAMDICSSEEPEDPETFARRAAQELFDRYVLGKDPETTTSDAETTAAPADGPSSAGSGRADRFEGMTVEEIVDDYSRQRKHLIDGFRGMRRWHLTANREYMNDKTELRQLDAEWKEALGVMPTSAKKLEKADERLTELRRRRDRAICHMITMASTMRADGYEDRYGRERAREVYAEMGRAWAIVSWRTLMETIDWRKRAEAAVGA